MHLPTEEDKKGNIMIIYIPLVEHQDLYSNDDNIAGISTFFSNAVNDLNKDNNETDPVKANKYFENQ